MLEQEEEVHGKQRELDRLKDEEKELMTDIKKSEREIQRIEDDLKIVQELEEEVQIDMSSVIRVAGTNLSFQTLVKYLSFRRPRNWRSWRWPRST